MDDAEFGIVVREMSMIVFDQMSVRTQQKPVLSLEKIPGKVMCFDVLG